MKALRRSKIFSLYFYAQRRNLSSVADATLQKAAEEEEFDSVWECKDSNILPFLHRTVQECAKERAAMNGKSVHSQIIKFGYEADTLTTNMLINMYSKCGLVDFARKTFDEMPQRTLVSWNTLMGSYIQNKDGEEVLHLFVQMQREGTQFSGFTVSGVLCACAAKFAVFESKQLHAFALKVSLESHVFVSTALLDVYAKCGLMNDAFRVFDSMPERNDVTWSSMVAGYVQNELYEEAVMFFHRLQKSRVEHNQFTLSSIISACAAVAALLEGNQVHTIVRKTGFGANVYVASSLVDLYARCGCIKEAYMVFSNAEVKNAVIWNSMISGFARNARPLEAMTLFEKMQLAGFYPTEVTYVSVLSACGHMGLVDKGRIYFDKMKKEHNLSPNVYHYSCMVDILGRKGLVEEAKDLIENMPFAATPSMWGSVLASCRVHGNVEVAEIAAKHLFELEPNNAGNHVLLSNIYASKRRWGDVASTRKLLKDSEAKKERGKSWIQIKDKVHTFMVGERNHPSIAEVYSRLDELLVGMEKLGYKGKAEHDLHDVEESRKHELLRHHSEKLAFTFGLMCLPSNAPIRIMKNLRICGDCHSFMKFASKITGREIIVRDVNRFHHFTNGSCSCGEFW
ncbi:pentatricopeptide repeat-containing protein At5g04780, mitochondrial-like [Nicotiana tabacum]|uniref:Pentatricopeptide repeat-containing protein At5g04780-like n=2 Tax=Nicotiana TaxID=4085 RepID=A0A1S3YSY0_TOBAC|nr:PREDICTED: pentatricopeptide repeat-containing protein At5g04780 [Nicotiana sylvestris]XP_009758856.1 PREDICTED: pentatricopeptide repeat-containing protein At5g04780 [Nicotiana sylvestris]XP_009758857.1 PREDICTED: pentatricopeptide repeat-containing protein At5g04780 [Nicotiana sylvestris]XP_016455340.1 PREDICTED: pentatricopeptide repeat-containing protein At5g04780-like [Nicotiana tabacum]XP_016455341.1 PREDICTED: pentatricopeptide repeat-containing protein At5g04780-like [Nicotiana tabac